MNIITLLETPSLRVVTITRDGHGTFLGAIGVSGGTVDEDLVVARAAAEAVAKQ